MTRVAAAVAVALFAAGPAPAAAATIPIVIGGQVADLTIGLITSLAELFASKNVNIGVENKLLVRSSPQSLFVEFTGAVLAGEAFTIASEGPHWAFAFSVTEVEDEDRSFSDDQVAVSAGRLEHVVAADPADLLPAERWTIPLMDIEADGANRFRTIDAEVQRAILNHPTTREPHKDPASAKLSGTSFDGNFSVYTYRLEAVHVPAPAAGFSLAAALALLIARRRRRAAA